MQRTVETTCVYIDLLLRNQFQTIFNYKYLFPCFILPRWIFFFFLTFIVGASICDSNPDVWNKTIS